MKIIVSAYACSPYQGSEPGVGWGFIHELARRHELWVIVEEEKFRADIERYLQRKPDLAKRMHFHFLAKKRKRLLRKLWPPSYYWYYRTWHKQAFELAGKLHAEIGFDLSHQLTMVGFREPGYLWRLGIPHVWGPIGGMGLFPWRFLTTLGVQGAFYYFSYNCLNLIQAAGLKRPRLAAKAAGAGLICATRENQLWAHKYWGCESTLMAEVGLKSERVKAPAKRLPGESLRIVWSGVHQARKALPLGLKALSQLPSSVNWELHVLGDGPLSAKWGELAENLGISARCSFQGRLPRDKALAIMSDAHVLLITSLRDLNSTVIVEGLASGLPVICPDHCGFSDVITEECGIKIPLTSPQDTIRHFGQAVSKLEQDEALRQAMGKAALLRANDYLWSDKIHTLDDIYQRAVSAGKRPVR